MSQKFSPKRLPASTQRRQFRVRQFILRDKTIVSLLGDSDVLAMDRELKHCYRSISQEQHT